VPPTRCDEDNAASMHPYGVCDNAEPGPMRQRREGLFPGGKPTIMQTVGMGPLPP
jgi:hypothetical protein